MDLLSRIMAHDDDMVLFGTDASEYFIGWEAFREAVSGMFPALSETQLAVKKQTIKVHSSNSVAWFSELVDWNFVVDETRIQQHCRFTGLLQKRRKHWVIVQFHNSVPAS